MERAENGKAINGTEGSSIATISEVSADEAEGHVDAVELPYALGQVMNFSAFEVQFFPSEPSTGVQSLQAPLTIHPRTSSLKANTSSMSSAKADLGSSVQGASARDVLDSRSDAQPHELDSVTQREELKNQLSEQGYVPLPERIEEIR